MPKPAYFRRRLSRSYRGRSQRRDRRRLWRKSDRVIRPTKPGNAGGGKDPDFWCAFEDGEVEVIGDEPENTINDRTRPRLLCRKAKESHLLHKCRVRLVTRCVTFDESS